jgi:hypothetical protein
MGTAVTSIRRLDRMTRLMIPGAVLVLGLSACAGERSEVSPATDSPTQAAALTLAASPTLVPTPPSTSPTTAPTPTASPTALPTPTPFGAGVFAAPDSCTNRESGYRVAYPETWYSNAAMENPLNPDGEGIAACLLFAPTDFALVYGTETPFEVAIVIKRHEDITWTYGPYEGADILTETSETVAGFPARYQELQFTAIDNIAFRPGDRQASYIIDLGGGDYLVASTYHGPDYDDAKAVLDAMVRTLEVSGP